MSVGLGTWDASKCSVTRDREIPSPQIWNSLDSVNPEFETITDLLSNDPFPAAWRAHRIVIALLDLPPRDKFFLILHLLGTSLCGSPDEFCS